MVDILKTLDKKDCLEIVCTMYDEYLMKKEKRNITYKDVCLLTSMYETNKNWIFDLVDFMNNDF